MQDKNKFSISFKNTDKEQELKKWFMEQSEIIGPGNYIKQLLYKEMINQIKATKE
ncbi:hypothetical protein [Clostridium sp. LP20]|uniref:hypothetical protein n=1 Tax=Clostridium sp. LP20 TaxID=3418665 RepID=UPI003EE4C7F2